MLRTTKPVARHLLQLSLFRPPRARRRSSWRRRKRSSADRRSRWNQATGVAGRKFIAERFGLGEGAATVRRHDPEDFIVRFSRREDMEMVGAATVRRHDPEDFVVRFSRRRDGTGHSGGRCPVHADIDMATVAEDIPGHCGFIQVQAARRDEAGSSAC
jgi:hypothetical protein